MLEIGETSRYDTQAQSYIFSHSTYPAHVLQDNYVCLFCVSLVESSGWASTEVRVKSRKGVRLKSNRKV